MKIDKETKKEAREVFKKFRNCIYNDEGYCRMIKHEIKASFFAVRCHCKDCPYGNDKESRFFKDKIKKIFRRCQ